MKNTLAAWLLVGLLVIGRAGPGAARVRYLCSPGEWAGFLVVDGPLADQNGQNGQPGPSAPAGQAGLAPCAGPGDDTEAVPPAEQRRRLTRTWAVPATGRPFALDTRYGRVQINGWDKPEMRVEAELVARAETEAEARHALDALAVDWLDYEAKTGGVAVTTRFAAALRGHCGGVRYAVHYTVWLPRTTALRVSNSFGDVTVAADWQGSTALAVEYGNLRTARLDGLQNLLRIANGTATVPYARRASIDASYATLRLAAGQTIDLRNKYSDVDMGTVQDVTVHSRYGDVALGRVGSLRGSSGYSRFSVDRLGDVLDMALRYCPDFVVHNTGPDFRQINLDGGYSSIQLGFAEGADFRFDVSTEQGQLLVDPRRVRVLREARGPQSSDVLGVFGAQAAGAQAAGARAGTVNVKVRYGTVRFGH